jgi:deoxyxylulose-5-phosphate synthase
VADGLRVFGSGWSVPGQVAVGEERGAGRDGEAEGCAVDEGASDRGVERAGVGGRQVPGKLGGRADELPGGMAWEALNNIAAAKDLRLVIVVNDNGWSYQPTVGGIAEHLAAVRVSRRYEDVLAPQVLFEDLGLKYLGPIDGHDEQILEHALRRARDFGGPVLVHVVTKKGRSYLPAEQDEVDCLHQVPAAGAAPGTWSRVFGDELVAIGARRPDVVAITAAMLHPTGLAPFAAAYPDRIYDVGIAEQHALTSAAGLAMGGLHPVVALYATFLNRAFDQLLLDVALHRLPVTIALDRAGVTGPDGPSHHGMWDHQVYHAPDSGTDSQPACLTRAQFPRKVQNRRPSQVSGCDSVIGTRKVSESAGQRARSRTIRAYHAV